MIARLIWLIVAIVLVGGAMLLTAHYAHASVTVQREQINICINYGTKIGRIKASPMTATQLENAGDWLYFCMQQARWRFCPNCKMPADIVEPVTNKPIAPTCGGAGIIAYYEDDCWVWHNWGDGK